MKCWDPINCFDELKVLSVIYGKYLMYRKPFRFHWIIRIRRQSRSNRNEPTNSKYNQKKEKKLRAIVLRWKKGTSIEERKVVNLSFWLTIMMMVLWSHLLNIFRSHSRMTTDCVYFSTKQYHDAITSGNVHTHFHQYLICCNFRLFCFLKRFQSRCVLCLLFVFLWWKQEVEMYLFPSFIMYLKANERKDAQNQRKKSIERNKSCYFNANPFKYVNDTSSLKNQRRCKFKA